MLWALTTTEYPQLPSGIIITVECLGSLWLDKPAGGVRRPSAVNSTLKSTVVVLDSQL